MNKIYFFLPLFFVSCASVHLEAKYYSSDSNKMIANKIIEKFEEREAITPTEGIGIIVDRLPRSFQIQNGKLIAKKPFRVLGRFELGYFKTATAVQFPLVFHNYKSSAMKVLCYPQVPLSWATATMWSLLSPLAWPCIINIHEIENPSDAVKEAKRLAAIAGGNLVLGFFKRNRLDNSIESFSGWILKVTL